ncbi:uncharacterized protein LOC124145226 isoform X1 [Haliotis rufescens]|uniref:uncharacterized protein LOC124145226 isoform X1 n=1 Tax=Haliotis rufescens TaxID=6454 RepID=UPI00201F15B8|nr:uncharacterized protein LOC124145226 isoform X1 [Haliotis rufescens]
MTFYALKPLNAHERLPLSSPEVLSPPIVYQSLQSRNGSTQQETIFTPRWETLYATGSPRPRSPQPQHPQDPQQTPLSYLPPPSQCTSLSSPPPSQSEIPQTCQLTNRPRPHADNPSSTDDRTSLLRLINCSRLPLSMYDGKDSIAAVSWLKRFENFASVQKYSEEDQTKIFPLYLTDLAAEWYDGINNISLMSWSELRQAFLRRYAPSAVGLVTRQNDLLDRKQREGEPFRSFLQSIRHEAELLQRNEDMYIKDLILRNALPNIRMFILTRPLTSLKQVTDSAEIAEAMSGWTDSRSDETMTAINELTVKVNTLNTHHVNAIGSDTGPKKEHSCQSGSIPSPYPQAQHVNHGSQSPTHQPWSSQYRPCMYNQGPHLCPLTTPWDSNVKITLVLLTSSCGIIKTSCYDVLVLLIFSPPSF